MTNAYVKSEKKKALETKSHRKVDQICNHKKNKEKKTIKNCQEHCRNARKQQTKKYNQHPYTTFAE